MMLIMYDHEHEQSDIPATIEQEGHLMVIKPSEVSIQSLEGQRFLREHHEAVMEHMNAYPTLRGHLFTDKWAEDFYKKWRSDSRSLSSFCYPSFCLEPFQLESGLYPKEYL